MSTTPPLPLEFADEFLEAIDASRATQRTYAAALRRFARFLAPKGGLATLTALQRNSLVEFRRWLAEDARHAGAGRQKAAKPAAPKQRYSLRTVQNSLMGVTRFLEWLDVNRKLPADLSARDLQAVLRNARGRRRQSYRPKPIREAVPLVVNYYAELPLPNLDNDRRARQALSILRNRAITRTLFCAGLRANELSSLRRGQWDEERAVVAVVGKGEKPRRVGLDVETQTALKAYVQARDAYHGRRPNLARQPLFTRHDPAAQPTAGLETITTKTVWQVVADAVKNLKIDGFEIPDSLSPHDFRRYIATAMLSEGMRLEMVQDFLGHASPETTRIVYAHTWDEALEDAVATYRPTLSDAVARAGRKVAKKSGSA